MNPSRRTSKRALMGNHQQSWIWGRHAVLEAIRSDRWRPCELRFARDLPADLQHEIERYCEVWEVPGTVETAQRLQQLVRSSGHQGMIARMPEYEYLSADDVLDNLHERTLLLILDAVQDAFNFGAALRGAEVFGVDAVIVPERDQCKMTSQVVRSSAGAVHHLPITRISDLTGFLQSLREREVRLVAASEKAARMLSEVDLDGPTAIVLGNEHRGVADEHLAVCDEQARIPQSGRVGSLNIAVATGIALYEAVRQRTGERPSA